MSQSPSAAAKSYDPLVILNLVLATALQILAVQESYHMLNVLIDTLASSL